MALAGHVFVVDLDAKEKKVISSLITSNGGTVAYLVGPSTTHYLTTPELILKNGFKIQAATKHNIRVVSQAYVMEAVENYVPLVGFADFSTSEEVSQGTLTVYKGTQGTSNVPTINSILPNVCVRGTMFKVSILGDNFKPSSELRIKFGHDYVCQEIEYHCSSTVVATVRAHGLQPGEIDVSASNNSGKDYGNVVKMIIRESEDEGIQSWHRKEISALRNKIFQLQADLLDLQKMEYNLSVKFDEAITYPARPALPAPTTTVTRPQPTGQFRADLKAITQIKDKLLTKKPTTTVAPLKPSEDMSREARIFISSPFKDMNEERDLIVKRIIPKLKRLCMERDIVLTCVDLRWGVTEAQTQGAATLLMCLREIERCNIFIGLFGERYGWCLSENSYRKPSSQDELLMRTFATAEKEFPWINQYKDRSVTEIEMRMILDNHSQESKNAWFYLRDPYYVESVTADKKQDFLSEGEFEKAKLELLKKDIQKSSQPSSNYNRPTHLSEIISSDLTALINQKYPAGTELTPFKRERFLHSTYSRNLTRIYLPNEKLFMSLDLYASSNTTTPLVAFGDSGVGKSACLANWAKRYKEHHPEVVVIEHFIGCTAASSFYTNIMRRIMDELQDYLSDSTDDIPSELNEMEKVFPSWLERTLTRNKVNRVVIVMDGLDSLEEGGNARTLLWLPQKFPSPVRVVLSASPSRPLDILQKRSYEMLEITPLEEGERASFARQYLNINSKKLTEAQEHKIAKCFQTGNPRYLKVLLEDISMWGQFDQLDKRIESDLKAKDTSELYEIVLDRLEKDYDKDRKDTVKLFMSYIWVSRKGLFLDTELAHLLEAEKIDNNTFQALFLGVEDLLLSSGGLLVFSNRDIRKAVKQRYLKVDSERLKFHSKLAQFFEKTVEGVRERKVDELAYQLFQAEEWDKLQACITNLSMFNKLYSQQKFDLLKFWRSLQDRYDVVECYIKALERGDTLPADVLKGDLFYQVGRFLDDMAKYDGATKVLEKARHVYNVSSQNLAVAKTDLNLAKIMSTQAKYKQAEELLNKCLAIYIREKGEEDLAVSGVSNRLGGIYVLTNEFDRAEDCFQKSLRIRKGKLGTNHWKVAKTLTLMIGYHERRSNFAEGIECGMQALKIAEEEFGPDDISLTSILVAMGRIYMAQKQYDEAKAMYKRALKIAEEKFGKDHPRTAEIVYELGSFFFEKPEELVRVFNTEAVEKFKNKEYWNKQYSEVKLMGNKEKAHEKENKKGWSRDRAEKNFLRALSIVENTLGKEHPEYARILNRLGSLYIESVQYMKAEEFLLKALNIRIQTLGTNHSRVAQTYKHLFTLYNLQEKLDQSRECGEKALQVLRHLYGENNMDISSIYERLGDQCVSAMLREDAKTYFNKAKSIRISILGPDHKDTLAIDVHLRGLNAPPPPPPPPVLSHVTVEELMQQANVEITTEMKKQKGRDDLLDAIKNFGKMKEQLASAESGKKVQKKAAYEEQKKGWWKQNYKAGFDAAKVKVKPCKK